jgi:DNA-binding response OmpR family regulator
MLNTILVVNADPMDRNTYKRTLERGKYHVLTAASAAEAITLAISHQGGIDLFMIDSTLSDKSGPELLRTLDMIRPNRPVIWSTGDPLSVNIGPGQHMLNKPLCVRNLLPMVRAILGQQVNPFPQSKADGLRVASQRLGTCRPITQYASARNELSNDWLE